jgi:hypothetical protein
MVEGLDNLARQGQIAACPRGNAQTSGDPSTAILAPPLAPQQSSAVLAVDYKQARLLQLKMHQIKESNSPLSLVSLRYPLPSAGPPFPLLLWRKEPAKLRTP